jgi:Ulp1 family protease
MNDALMNFYVYFKLDSDPAGHSIHYFETSYSLALVDPNVESNPNYRIRMLQEKRVPEDLFDRKTIFLPYNERNHWSGLAWVNFHTMKDETPKSKILIFDSLKNYHNHVKVLDAWKTHIYSVYISKFNIPEDEKKKIRRRFNSVEIIRCCEVCDSLL